MKSKLAMSQMMNRKESFIRAIAGHFVDLYSLLAFKYKNPYNLTKYRHIKSVKKSSRAQTLIEVGTFRGVTTKRCSRIFDKVVTIEVDKNIYDRTEKTLKRFCNVEPLLGDGLKLLPIVLNREDIDNVLIYLDGHFSGPGTGIGELAEPACEEIKIMASYQHKINAFIIDDFRCFGVDHGWPKKSEVIAAIENTFGHDVMIYIHLDQIIVINKQT